MALTAEQTQWKRELVDCKSENYFKNETDTHKNTEDRVRDINDRGERMNVYLISKQKVEERENGAE